MKRGKLTVIVGPMFSGKTGKLVALTKTLVSLNIPAVVIKPKIDSRYTDKPELHSHDHRTTTAKLVSDAQLSQLIKQLIQEKPHTVIIDEVQFFDKETALQAVEQLRSAGINVIIGGLLYDFRRRPFGATPQLFKMADANLLL